MEDENGDVENVKLRSEILSGFPISLIIDWKLLDH